MYTSFVIILVRYGKRLKYQEAHSLMEGYYLIKVVSVLLKMLHRGIVCLCVCMRERVREKGVGEGEALE